MGLNLYQEEKHRYGKKKCWKLPKNVTKCQKMLNNKKMVKMQKNTKECRKMSKDTEK